MSISNHHFISPSKTVTPRGPNMTTWLTRHFMLPPATAAVIAQHAGFRARCDDWESLGHAAAAVIARANETREARL
jgi:hypothetical protein